MSRSKQNTGPTQRRRYASLRDVYKPPVPSAGWQERMIAVVREDLARRNTPVWRVLTWWRNALIRPELAVMAVMGLLLWVWEPDYSSYLPGLGNTAKPQVVERTVPEPVIVEWDVYFDAMGVMDGPHESEWFVPVGTERYDEPPPPEPGLIR